MRSKKKTKLNTFSKHLVINSGVRLKQNSTRHVAALSQRTEHRITVDCQGNTSHGLKKEFCANTNNDQAWSVIFTPTPKQTCCSSRKQKPVLVKVSFLGLELAHSFMTFTILTADTGTDILSFFFVFYIFS